MDTSSCGGQCQVTSLPCSGSYQSGLCPGASDIQCCSDGPPSPGPGPSPAPGQGNLSVDVSELTSTSAFNCLAGKGISNAIVRAYRSSGSVDPHAAATMANARSAGMRVSIYIFPCPKCGTSGSQQINDAVQNLVRQGQSFDIIWLDVEGGSTYWSTNPASNVAFFNSMVQGAQSLGLTVGVYASKNSWTPIMGSSTVGSSFPLWYPHYDNNPSFSDFKPFNGWTRPYMKQYEGDGTLCGVGVDLSWQPSSFDHKKGQYKQW